MKRSGHASTEAKKRHRPQEKTKVSHAVSATARTRVDADISGRSSTCSSRSTVIEVQEADIFFIGEALPDDEEDDGKIPIRYLDQFIFFHAQSHEHVSLMNVLTEEACEDWIGVGNVLPVPDLGEGGDEDDEDDEDDKDETDGDDDDNNGDVQVGVRVKLSSILECSVHYVVDDVEPFDVDPHIYILTRCAWYILRHPAAPYRTLYHDLWVQHHLTHGVLTLALRGEGISSKSLLQQLRSTFEQEEPAFPLQRLSDDVLELSCFISYFAMVMDHMSEQRPRFCRRVVQCPLISKLCPSLLAQLSTLASSRSPSKPRDIEKFILQRHNLKTTVVTSRVAIIAKDLFSQALSVAQLEDSDPEATSCPCSHPVHLDNPVSIEWEEQGNVPNVYHSVRVDGALYSAGDVVMVVPGFDPDKMRAVNAQSAEARSLNDLANTKWFCKIFYFYEDVTHGSKMFHAQWLEHGSKTLLQEIAHSRSLFWLKECSDLSIECIHSHCTLTSWPSGEPEPVEDVRSKENVFFTGLTLDRDNQSFVELSFDERVLALEYCEGSKPGKPCIACGLQLMQEAREEVTPLLRGGISYKGVDYHVNDFVYVHNRGGGLLLEIAQIVHIESITVGCKLQVRCYGRYDHVALQPQELVSRDNRRLFMTETFTQVDILSIEGKVFVDCPFSPRDKEVWVRQDDHFYCDLRAESLHPHQDDLHDLDPSVLVLCDECNSAALEGVLEEESLLSAFGKLKGLELFAGAGGLATGLKMSGFVETKWAVEFSPAAAKTYKTNHEGTVVYNQCSNLLLEHAIATAEGRNPPPLLSSDELVFLPPMPTRGEVDFIYGGPPCQSFSRMNHQRHKNGNDVRSTLVCNMISYVEFYRPAYFLLENVSGILDYNTGKGIKMGVVKFILRSLMALGYQIHFKLLQAAQYGSPQARKRVFFFGARRGFPLPDFPLPQYAVPVPDGPKHITIGKCKLPNKETMYPPFRCGVEEEGHQCAPLSAITVDEAIGDLPRFEWCNPHTESSKKNLRQKLKHNWSGSISQFDATSKHQVPGFGCPTPYMHPPLSRYQSWMRDGSGDQVLSHYTKSYKATVVDRVINVPLLPHANHADLPGYLQIPRLFDLDGKPMSTSRALFGRIDGDGLFVTAMTTLSPSNMGGKVLHPNQRRVISIREYARSQGFPDNYLFLSTKDSQHAAIADHIRQIGNAVPVPLALALGKAVGKTWIKVLRQKRDGQQRERVRSPEAV